jgi:hypothetical protein
MLDRVTVLTGYERFKHDGVRSVGSDKTQDNKSPKNILVSSVRGRSLVVAAKIERTEVPAIIDTAAMITVADESLFPYLHAICEVLQLTGI